MATGIVVIALVAAVAAAVVGVFALRNRQRADAHTKDLQARFGPEYERAVAAMPRREAEAELVARATRVDAVALDQATPAQIAEFHAVWEEIQARVVASPTRSVVAAQRLFEDVLTAQGYPRSVAERIDVFSVHHPTLAPDYRAALLTAVEALDGHATTEECRQALLRYRRLFDGLLGPADPEYVPSRERIDLRSERAVEPTPAPETVTR